MAWYNSSKELTNSFKNMGNRITGGAKDSGIMGMGQYKGSTAKIDETAFTDKSANDARRGEFANALKQSNARTGAKMDTAQSDQWRERQTGLADALKAQMDGKGGPSIAEMQMQKGLNQSLANSNSQAASMRGVNPAMALRMTQNNAAAQNQDMVGQTGMLRAQEQQAARDQYGQLTTGARGQDMDIAAANQNSTMNQRGMNDAQDRFIRSGQMQMDESDRQSKMDLGKLRVNENAALNSTNAAAYGQASQAKTGFLSGILGSMSDEATKKASKVDPSESKREGTGVSASAPTLSGPGAAGQALGNAIGGGAAMDKFTGLLDSVGGLVGGGGGGGLGAMIGAMSDEKTKSPGDGNVRDFLNALSAHRFTYKEPEKFGGGEHLGIMAQDLEKTPIGKTMVQETPEGKMVNYAKAGGAMLATSSMLNDRLSDLEKAFASRKKARA